MAAGDNAFWSDVSAAVSPPTCWLVQQVAQTGWTSATATAITFGASSEVIDTDVLHDTASNTSRIVIGKKLGWWEISGVYCAPNSTAITALRTIIYKNGSAVVGSFGGTWNNASGAFLSAHTPTIYLEATVVTDYVELMGYQTAASGTIGTGVNSYVASSFRATFKRPS